MKAILACDKSGGIGKDGAMPWPKDKKDLSRFKELTQNSTIIMGRSTWESTDMPKPLPNRQNIVVSSKHLTLPELVLQIDNLTDLDIVDDFKIDWCIGGAKLFHSLFDKINEIHLTHFRKNYDCDTHIDLARIRENFDLVSDQMCITHNYEIWKRKKKVKK